MTANASLTDQQFQFYYRGLYSALKRYRAATILGWIVVLAGVAAVPLWWGTIGNHGLIDVVLSCCTITAGLALVSESVSFLTTYLTVPFPVPQADNGGDVVPEAVREIQVLMGDIEAGGWQDAYAGITKVRALAAQYGLSLPD